MEYNKHYIRSTLTAILMTGAVLSSQPAMSAEYDTTQQLNVTIAFGPGGGNDILARTLIDILQKYDFYPGDIVATNRAGGSGAIGWGYLYSQKGDPYQISTTSGSFIATPLQANTPWDTMSFTHVALMASDDTVLVVNADSPIRSFEDFVESAKNKPPAIGGIGSVNNDYIVSELLSEEADYDYDYVPFNQQGELTTALLSHSLDAMMANPGDVVGLIDAGDFRALAFSGEKVPQALGDVPSFEELDVEKAAVPMPRGLVMPPDVPEEARQWWIDTVKKVVDTPEWKKYIETNFLTENIRFGDDFTGFLDRSVKNFRKVLSQAGAIQAD